MNIFGWIAGSQDPPDRWDLRTRGWNLCNGHSGHRSDCRHVLLVDVRELDPAARIGIAEADRPAWRIIMLGVEEAAERAQLLILGCAEALPDSIQLRELEARARRVADMFGVLPRWRSVGSITLDLFHRDARRQSRWLHLHPREFGLLWRLADNPGERVSRRELLRDVWRIDFEPETNSVEVHVSRLRAKLAAEGYRSLIETAPGGGYQLSTAEESFMLGPSSQPQEDDALDAYLRASAFWNTSSADQESPDQLPGLPDKPDPDLSDPDLPDRGTTS